jgi:hypothetical protein
MKGIHAIIVAVGLGVAGAIVNFAYLNSRAREIEKVSFIGVKKDAVIGRGERVAAESLVEVGIPRAAAGNLKDFVFLWDELSSVDGLATSRTVNGGTLLAREDFRTPPPELELAAGETAMWIPVGGTPFVPSLLVPGDMVSFKVPTLAPAPLVPNAAPATAEGDARPADSSDLTLTGPVETIGPFKILSIGNRLGSAEVMRGAKIPQLQENVLTIRVSKDIAGEPERADKLWSRLQASNFRQVGIVLHSRKGERKK